MLGVMSFTGVASTSGANQCTSTPVIIGLLSLPISRHPTAIVGEDSILLVNRANASTHELRTRIAVNGSLTDPLLDRLYT